MTFRRRAFFALAVAAIWLGCGGSEFSQIGDDGGAQGGTTAGATGTSTTGTGIGTSGTGTGTTGTGAGSAATSVSATSGTTGTSTSVSATSTGGGGASSTGAGTSGAGGAGGKGGGTTGAGGAGGKAGSDAAGNGGQSIDASRSDATVSCGGDVTFHMSAANGQSSDYCVGSSCTGAWLTITSSSGTAVSFGQGCSASCADCRFVACPPILCALPQPMKPDGETQTWDGTDWELGTCGSPQTSCRSHQCAAPGHYVAKMCASRSTPDGGQFNQCSANQTPTCVEVPFDYPGPTMVEGKIP